MAKPGKNDPAALSALPAGASMTAPRSEGPRPSRKAKGLAVTRRVTKDAMTAMEVLDAVEWTRRPAKISGADGEVVFKMDDAEVAAGWSELASGRAYMTEDAYTRPQVSACFIQSCKDDLDSIFSLVHDEARVFKYGSGSGTNFSKLRGKMERLSGGGTSSGLMSFLEVLDKAAGATKSGGITRRAAKMVVIDADHPEIRDFVQWKAREEKKVKALIAAGYPADFNGDAYRTVSGQNANNSVRIKDGFMAAVDKNGAWETTQRTTGEVVDRLDARELWMEMAEAAWKCADPGLQFDDTINKWHTCKATDRIFASNPCSEFVF